MAIDFALPPGGGVRKNFQTCMLKKVQIAPISPTIPILNIFSKIGTFFQFQSRTVRGVLYSRTYGKSFGMVKKHEIAHNSATVGPTNCLPLLYLKSFNNYLYTGKKSNAFLPQRSYICSR